MDKVLAKLSPAQFNEWWAEYKLKPWGNDWDIGAMITAKIHNTNVGAEGIPLDPDSLIPCYDNAEKAKVEEQGTNLASTWEARIARNRRA